MSLDPNRVEEVFTAALQQGGSEERAAFLETASAGDAALRDRVEALLRAHGEASHFLARAAVEQVVAQPDPTEALASRPNSPELTVTSAEQPGDDEDNPLGFLQPATRPDALGRLGHYEVLEVLGKGGFGIVLKAFDELLHRVVAIKVMSTQLAVTSPARKRFLREARAAAAIRYENVVAIYAVEDQPIPYLVMEYVAGETLQQRLDRMGPLDTPEVLRLGQQITAGLAAAHAIGLIHRDVKPSNILLENGVEQRVKLTDFGLARTADDASLTQSGYIAGTPMYMAPEQAEGKVIDQRADLFSLGSVLYMMCSGRPPFRASGTLAVLKRVTEDTPRPIREIIPEVPEWLCALIARLHAKNPAERYQTAKEVADLLSRQPAPAPPPASTFPANNEPPRARQVERPVASVPPAPRTHRVRTLLLAALSCAALACIAGAIFWLTRDKEPPVSPPGFTSSVPPLAKAPFSAAEARQHQEVWARYLGAPVENTNSADMKMVLVPPGEFLMGMTDEQVETGLKDKAPGHWLYNNYRESRPQHKVTISKPFYMAATEVTVAQFRAFIADTGYRTEAERDGKGGTRWDAQQKQLIQEKNLRWETPGYAVSRDMPVTQITWNDAVAYCNWLSKREARSRRYAETRESWEPVSGDGYSLPTEAQWEYACKAGTTTLYSCGTDEETLSKYAWYSKNSEGRPHPVGTKLANAFGLFDMHGNAAEFCQDFYDPKYYKHSEAIDPQGPDFGKGAEFGKYHVRRGGEWAADADAAPSALRLSLQLHKRQQSTGFRVVRELPNVSGAKIENSEPPRAVVTPFVLLTKDAQAERKFATLAEAVAAAQSGDTVEIRGNGPFVAAPFVLLEKRLTIRAGKGYHPVLTPSTETPKWQPFFDTNAPLVLEGLEFRINGQPFALPEKNAYRYAIRTRQPLYLANCRFVAKSGAFATIRSSGSSCQLLNCQFLGADLHGALDWESSNGGKVLLKNCQQAGNVFWFACHDDSPELNNVTIQLTENTVLAGPPLALMLGTVPGQVEAPFRMEASRNILQAARQAFSLSVTNEAVEKKLKGNKAEVLKQLVRWQGQENVYGNKADFLYLGEGAPVRSLQDWKQFWGSAEEKSQRELPSFEGGDLLKLAATDPERMEANHFRLKVGSPGKGAGPGGKDIGADAALVGPGAAYEKWKQTPEYQEWRKKTDALLGAP